MNEEKKTTTLEDTVKQAEQLEAEAQAEADICTYTHTFQRPFTYEGITYEDLTFRWDSPAGGTALRLSGSCSSAASPP